MREGLERQRRWLRWSRACHWLGCGALAWGLGACSSPAPSGGADGVVIADVGGASADTATRSADGHGGDLAGAGADASALDAVVADSATPPDAGASQDGAVGDTSTGDVAALDAWSADGSSPDTLTTDTLTADTLATDASGTDTLVNDSASSDSASTDSAQPDTAPADTTLPPVACSFGLTWTGPAAGTFHAAGDSVTLTGTVATSPFPLSQLTVAFSANSVLLGSAPVAADGKVAYPTTALPQGAVTLEARVITPKGPCTTTSAHALGVCSYKIAESFDSKPTGKVWKTFGDAYWDKGGWLEMTGAVQSKQGAFYDVVHNVTPGDVSVRFRIATGGGINGGADGYALNFVEAQQISELETIVKTAKKGGCLGYGVAGKCGTLKINGFHVEFDTWQNKGDPNTDPTSSNHIGILVNGDPGDHKLFAPLSNLEDLKWHDVGVDVIGTQVRVYWDGVKKIDKTVTDLDFRGGRIFISGSTGWATNYHRLDDLVVLHGCK